MKKSIGEISIAIAIVSITGCGSFPLGTAYAPPGVTQHQLDFDILSCKDRAHHEANTSERQIGSFLAGMTLVGVPIAIEAEKAKQREIYKQCMEARGYRIELPKEAR